MAAPDSPPCPFAELPEALHQTIISFLPQWDVGTLLQLSKALGPALACGIETLQFDQGDPLGTYQPEALLRLLHKTTNLQELSVHCYNVLGATVGPMLLGALGDGSVGGQLRSLCLRVEGTAKQLASLLHAGHLPALAQLQVYDNDTLKRENCLAIVDALEARRDLGLLPITRLGDIACVEVDLLRRVLACCPLDQTMALTGSLRQLPVLEAHLRASAVDLTNLRFLSLRCGGGEDESFTGVIGAIAHGRAPRLQEIELMGNFGGEVSSLGPLGQAIGQNHFPALSSLEMWHFLLPPGEFRAFVDGMRGYGGLRRLTLNLTEVSAGDMEYLISALKSQEGGFGRLEDVSIDCRHLPLDHLLVALAEGAPCAKTLTKLTLDDASTFALEPFLHAFAGNVFPSLRELNLRGDQAARGVARALLALANKHTPCRLTDLCPDGALDWAAFIQDLTQVFDAGGLDCLVYLGLDIDREGEEGVAALFEPWKALGPKIKLEWLYLDAKISDSLQAKLLEYLADPAFCPYLRRFSTSRSSPTIKREDVDAALEARRQKREALAAAAGGH